MQQLTGIILADAMYTVEGVTAALGIGREAQREARLSGALRSVRFGRRVYYRGRDVIAWMESTSKGPAVVPAPNSNEADQLFRDAVMSHEGIKG